MRVRVVVLGAVAALIAAAACEDEESIAPPTTSVATTGGSAGASSVASSGSGGGNGGTGGQAVGGSGPQGDWSCLGSRTAPRWDSGAPSAIDAAVADWLGLNAIPDVTVRVCDYTDPSCQNPTSQGTSDSQGIASVFEAVDHRQFYEFSLASVIAPTLRFFNGPPPAPLACSMPDLAACECEGCTLPQCDDGNGNFADCTCAQCATDPYCSNPNNCTDDSVCDPYFEGCVCSDCMAHPLCGGSGGGGAGGQGGAGGGSGFSCIDVTMVVPVFIPNALLSPNDLADAMQAMGVTDDPTRGHIHVEMFDCAGDAPPGVTITVDTADGQTVYGYVGTSGNFEPALSETSILGQAGVFNLPPGEAIITPVVMATGETLPVRRVQVRAGTVTFAAAIDAVPEAQ